MRVEIVKAAVKALGIKGFRKLKLKRELYVIGKQCDRLDPLTANNLIKVILGQGWEVQQLSTCLELADKGLLDTLTVKPR
ncbi:hypothetical protein ACEQMD_003208 [Salmonella enterica]